MKGKGDWVGGIGGRGGGEGREVREGEKGEGESRGGGEGMRKWWGKVRGWGWERRGRGE